ncbi:MAG: LPS export ABC transporter periplasmic protein LptC [Chitinophagaceae bacterium]|nr:LPS export ABC transporter periplasmic protein LptC [Chitinophagaceae bacterium]
MCSGAARAQLRPTMGVTTPATDTTPRMVNIEKADRLRYKKVDSTNELQIAAGDVYFRDGKTKVYCDSAVYNKNLKIVEAFGNVHIIDSDTIHTYSKYLIYHSDTKMANLEKQVKLTDGKTILTTQNLDYNTNLKIGTYRNGGKIVSGKTVITSQEAVYYSELKDVYFKRDVKLKDPGYDLMTDSLLYNTESQLATFITETYIKDSSGTEIVTDNGFYDLKNKKSELTGRSTVKDKSLTVTGDELAMDDESGMFEAKGNAIMIDTAQGLTLLANNIKANRQNNTFLATQHPLMILEQNNDSVYVTADTLFSGLLKDDSVKSVMTDITPTDTTLKKELDSMPPSLSLTKIDTFLALEVDPDKPKDTANTTAEDSTNQNRFFKGFHNVRIFSDSLQAVSDSLFYSGRDSVFRLYKDPILWANKSQVTGDTIYLFTRNKKPDRLRVFENAMMINLAKGALYNQLKGTTIDAYFKGGDIDFVESVGSPAESIYYVQDEDSAFVGMNTATARNINMYFLAKELNRVVYKKEVAGTTYPILQVPEEKKILRNFKWQDNRRPKTKFELFEDLPEPESPAPIREQLEEQITIKEKKVLP